MADGTRPYVDGQVWDEDDANQSAGPNFNKLTAPVGASTLAVLGFSSTAICSVGQTATRTSADAGVTWSDAAGDSSLMDGLSGKLAGSATTALVCDELGQEVSFTTDAGANWTQQSGAGTVPPNCTAIFGLSFPTSAVAVIGGTASAGAGLWYIDETVAVAAGVWHQATATGFDNSCVAVHMFSATTGFAVELTTDSIWKTTDGGINWTDTTAVVATTTSTADATLISTSATTGVLLCKQGGDTTVVSHWTGTTVTSTLNWDGNSATGHTQVTNLVQTTDGNIYFILYFIFDDGASIDGSPGATLFKSVDDGVTWQQAPLGVPLWSLIDYNIHFTKSSLVEMGSNVLLWQSNLNQHAIIDVSGGLTS